MDRCDSALPDPYEHTLGLLQGRGVELEEIAMLVLDLQSPYLPYLTLATCLDSVRKVLEKREVQYAILTGLALDVLAERKLIDDPLYTILRTDDTLYGIDEILSLSIVNVYGTIGFTNFGYLDKTKPGVIGRINRINQGVNTFLDDILAAIAAAAAARLAHSDPRLTGPGDQGSP